GSGKLVMESVVETHANSILQFIHGLRGELHVTWDEGTWAAWLHDLLKVPCGGGTGLQSTAQWLIKGGHQERQGTMRVSWPSCCARTCYDRSATENMDCGRCASWGAVIRPSVKM